MLVQHILYPTSMVVFCMPIVVSVSVSFPWMPQTLENPAHESVYEFHDVTAYQ